MYRYWSEFQAVEKCTTHLVTHATKYNSLQKVLITTLRSELSTLRTVKLRDEEASVITVKHEQA